MKVIIFWNIYHCDEFILSQEYSISSRRNPVGRRRGPRSLRRPEHDEKVAQYFENHFSFIPFHPYHMTIGLSLWYFILFVLQDSPLVGGTQTPVSTLLKKASENMNTPSVMNISKHHKKVETSVLEYYW